MRIGYILKRFPRASETFIAQEILGLERQGMDIVIFALRPNDVGVEHSWLSEIAAPIYIFESQGFTAAWRALQKRAREGDGARNRAHAAILTAFDHPKRSGKGYLAEACWIDSIGRELGIEHWHAHFANHPSFVAMLVHQLSGASFSFTTHAKDIYRDGPTTDLWRRQLDEASFAVTVTRSNRRHLESVLGAPAASKIATLPNGIDVDRIQPTVAAADRDLTISAVGRLVEKKGIDLLIDAAPQILEQFPQAEFVVAGEGPQAAALRDRVAGLSLEGRFRFLGALPHQRVIELMARSQVFVLPCRVASDGDRDALPTVLLEAMAVGTPCVSTPTNGVPEIILQGRTGLIVPENDTASLAAAVSQILRDRDLRRRMGLAGRKRIENHFDLATSTGRLKDLFEAAVGAAEAEAVLPSTGSALTRGV